MSSNGDSAIWAFLMAVTALVTPGPAVTAATPMRPEGGNGVWGGNKGGERRCWETHGVLSSMGST